VRLLLGNSCFAPARTRASIRRFRIEIATMSVAYRKAELAEPLLGRGD
jgi:hypothetical protein